MNGAYPEVCESRVVACRRFFDDGRCPLGWRSNLLGHGSDGVGDRCEVQADVRLVCWWLEASFWCGVVPPYGVAFLRIIVGCVYEALVVGDGGLEGLCCPAVEGAPVGPDPGGPPETLKRDLLYAYQGLKDTTKDAEPVDDHLPASIHQGTSNLHSDEDMEDKITLLDPRVQKLFRTYLEVFGELPPPASCDELVQMDLKLKPEFVGHKIRRRPDLAAKEQANEIERQKEECIDAGLVLEYKDGDYPQHCSPCFLVAKPGSTAKGPVVDYGELNKKTLNHSGSIPNMESTLEKIASCRYKTKMDKQSEFWQVDLTPMAQELLAFITPQGRVFKWKVMPFGVANAPALFQELMNKILSILRWRPVGQEVNPEAPRWKHTSTRNALEQILRRTT